MYSSRLSSPRLLSLKRTLCGEQLSVCSLYRLLLLLFCHSSIILIKTCTETDKTLSHREWQLNCDLEKVCYKRPTPRRSSEQKLSLSTEFESTEPKHNSCDLLVSHLCNCHQNQNKSSVMLIFYPILFNGIPATMVNLSNLHFGVYCPETTPINLRLHQMTRIKTGANLNQLRITYDQSKKQHQQQQIKLEQVEITFFSRSDRDDFLANLVEAQLVDRAKCCYLFLPAFLLRSCCGLFRYNELYVRRRSSAAANNSTVTTTSTELSSSSKTNIKKKKKLQLVVTSQKEKNAETLLQSTSANNNIFTPSWNAFGFQIIISQTHLRYLSPLSTFISPLFTYSFHNFLPQLTKT